MILNSPLREAKTEEQTQERTGRNFGVRPEEVGPTRLIEIAPTTLTACGDWRAGEFTLQRHETLLFRFVSDHAALATILMPDQKENLSRNRMLRGFGDFNARNGMLPVTLKTGSYLLAIRGLGDLPNRVMARLDRPLSLPMRLGLKFHDTYLQRTVSVEPYGGKYLQPFTIQTGTLYFLSGCNSGLPGYVIPASEQVAFAQGRRFRLVGPFSNPQGKEDYPNCLPLSLPAGDYAFAFENPSETPKSFTLTLDRWIAF